MRTEVSQTWDIHKTLFCGGKGRMGGRRLPVREKWAAPIIYCQIF